MRVNFASNTICIHRKSFNLDEIRRFLLDTQPTFCLRFQVGSHKVGDALVYTYDWGKLFRTFGVEEHLTLRALREEGLSPLQKHNKSK